MRTGSLLERNSPARPERRRDPVLLASAGFLALCLLLALPAFVSPAARGFYEAGFAAMYEAMAGMAAACQWTY